MSRLLAIGSVWIVMVGLAVAQDSPQPPTQLPSEPLPALLVRKIAPIYPPLARQARIQGTVVLSILISKDGDVRDPKLVSGHPTLAPAAIEAVLQWRYRPFILNGEAVPVEITVQVKFAVGE